MNVGLYEDYNLSLALSLTIKLDGTYLQDEHALVISNIEEQIAHVSTS
jgi:hypothetical protein